MTVPDVISSIKDVLITVAAGITAYVAFNGLSKWKSEIRGKAEFDSAKALLISTYRLRDEIKQCRNGFIASREFPEEWRA